MKATYRAFRFAHGAIIVLIFHAIKRHRAPLCTIETSPDFRLRERSGTPVLFAT
jgi:hypothetical protein